MPDKAEFERRWVYVQHDRDIGMELGRDAAKSFDQAMLTLSGGALGLSLTFLKNFSANPAPCTRWLLILAWSLFAAAVLWTLLGFLNGEMAYNWEIQNLHDYATQKVSEIAQFNPHHGFLSFLKFAAIACFVLGAISLIIFCGLNLP